MSKFIQTRWRWLLPIVLTACVLTIVLATSSGEQFASAEPDEIVLVAKDVAFRLADRPDEPNPPLRLTKGRSVRLIIRNDEPEKVLHCFTIVGLDVGTSRDLATGESEVLTFTPGDAGTFAYACLMHPGMSGKIVVQ